MQKPDVWLLFFCFASTSNPKCFCSMAMQCYFSTVYTLITLCIDVHSVQRMETEKVTLLQWCLCIFVLPSRISGTHISGLFCFTLHSCFIIEIKVLSHISHVLSEYYQTACWNSELIHNIRFT